MPANPNSRVEGDFPKGLSAPARRALAGAGYTRLDQLTAASEDEIMRLHSFGQKGLDLLRNALAERGLAFAQKGD